jgi:hypothetical protein
MDRNEKIRLVATAIAAGVVGQYVGEARTYMKLKRSRRRKYADNRSDSILLAVQGWLNNPRDNRPLSGVLEQVVFDSKFKEITNEK